MSQYYGDIDLDDTVEWLFTTVNGSGVPTILTGSPTATAYTNGGVTQSATGVTLTANFDSVTGLNKISIVATSGNGFAVGENIEIVLNAGTVAGNTVVGYAVGSFSIANRSPLRPTTIGRTLDVAATGEAGLNFGNTVGAMTGAQLGVGVFATGAITAGAIATSALNGKGDWSLATVLGALADAAAADEVTASDTVVAYIKQLINILVGAPGIVTLKPAAAPASGVSMSEMLRAVYDDSNSLDGTKIPDILSLVNINAEVLDVSNVDTVTLPGQVAPPLAPTERQMMAWLYKTLRNRKTQNSTDWKLFADNETTVDAKATVSDVAGLATKQEIVAGP